MAITTPRGKKADSYQTWTQQAFLKVWAGSGEVGIAQAGYFYYIPGAEKGQTVYLRRLNKMSAYTVEYALAPDALVWHQLRNGRPI